MRFIVATVFVAATALALPLAVVDEQLGASLKYFAI
jgi:hypothetical protein